MAETLTQIAPAYDPLVDLVVSNGIIDQPQADELREEHARTGSPVRKLLIDLGYVTEDDLLGMMAAYQGCEVVDLGVMSLDTSVIVPAEAWTGTTVYMRATFAGMLWITSASSDITLRSITSQPW